MELDEETRAELGWGDFDAGHSDGAFRARAVDQAERAGASERYQRTPKYRVAHRAAALRYYHRNKHSIRVRVRGRNAAQSPETAHHERIDTKGGSRHG